MGFQRTVPKSVGALREYLLKIHENRKHVKGVTVNPSTCHLEIVLDFGAHVAGNPDVYLPLKRASLHDAKDLVEKMLRESEGGYPPSDSEALRLFDMIDPTGS